MSSASTQKQVKPALGRGRLVLAGIALVLLSACAVAVLAATKPPTPSAPTQAPALPAAKLLAAVEVLNLVPVDLTEALHLSGEVKPLRHVSLSAQVSGLAGEVSPRPGDAVTQGDLLLSIASEDYRLALDSAKAELSGLQAQITVARSTFDRAQRLSQSGASSAATLEQAKNAVAVLDAGIAEATIRVAQARTNLERTMIRAPISGTLANRSVEPGQLVQAGDALFDIIDLNRVSVEAMIPVGQAANLSVGQAATLWGPHAPSTRMNATITRIAPQTTSGTRSVSVWLDVDNSHAGLRVGSFLRGEMRYGQKLVTLDQAAA